MKYFNRFLPKSRSRIALFAAVLFCAFSACYDDTFDDFRTEKNNSPYISFNIIGDTASAASRSGADGFVRNVYTLAAEEGGDTLYLIEKEYEGIAIDRNDKPASRGEKVGDYGKNDIIGLYGFKSPEEGESLPPADTELKYDHWTLRDLESAYPRLYKNLEDQQPRDNERWPGYPLDFVAYYPYTEAFEYDTIPYKDFVSKDDSEYKIEKTFKEEDYKEHLYGWVWSPNHFGLRMHPIPRNGMYLIYKVPDSIKNQKDLMADYIQNQTHSPCKLSMKHLLTAIRFETAEDMHVCTIKKIVLSGVRSTGYMSVMNFNNEKESWWEKPENGEDDDEFTADLKKKASELTSYVFDFGEDGFMLKEDPEAEHDENRKGYTSDGQSLLGDENQVMLLLPQELEKASVFIELEYKAKEGAGVYNIKQTANLKGTWKPGVTITYKLSTKKPAEMPMAELHLVDENGMPLKEIKVGYIGGETDYKVASYLNYRDSVKGIFKRLPMPWKASIVTFDETDLDANGKPKEKTIISYEFKSTNIGGVDVDKIKEIIDSAAYKKEFGSIKRIEFDYYGENIPASLEAMADDPVKTFVMIPKIVMKKTSSPTAYMRGLDELYPETAPFNLASRGIGLAKNGLEIFHKNGMDPEGSNDWTDKLAREYTYTEDTYGDKDINTANCYIVSAPGWYTFPLVYGNAVKDGCINYSAYVFKSNNHGESKSNTLITKDKYGNPENKILQYAIRHDGERI